MNDKERSAKFAKHEKEIRKSLNLLTATSIKDAIKLLEVAKLDIEVVLKGTPTEWQTWHLSNAKADILSVLNQLKIRLTSIGTTSSTTAWQSGISMIDAPLISAGMIDVVHNLPTIDINRIGTNKAFMLDRLTDISSSLVSRINAQLGAVSIGATTRHDAINNIAKMLTSGGKVRAKTILGTELGRMAEIAIDSRRTQAQKLMPGMKKEWRKSGKIHSREDHDLAHGQIKKINEPFLIAGIKMDYPRDPKAPAKQTINCGCYTRTRFDSWEVKKEEKT